MGFKIRAHRTIPGVLALGLAVFAPVSATADTLASALTSAYKHSGLLEQNRALLRAADEDVAQAVARLGPVLNWSASVLRSHSRSSVAPLFNDSRNSATNGSINLVADWLIYDFGQTPLSIEIAKETVLATRQALVTAEQAVLQRAVIAYMNVRRAHEFVALGHSNVRLITEELRAAKDRFEVGEVTRTDVSLAEARLAAARAGLAAAQGDLVQAQEEYRAAIGHRPGTLAAPPPLPATAKSPADAKQVAVRMHPDMLRAQHDVTARELNVELQRRAFKPTINLTGSLGISETLDGQGYTRGGSIGIEANGPIYSGGAINSRQRQAIANRDAARANLHQIRHAVSQNVGNAYSQMLVASASREAGERQVRASRVAFRGVREEATLGARTTLDVLDAEQELLDAQARVISALADEQIAAYSLLASMGLLTAERLNLNVQRYDPTEYYNLVKSAPSSYSKQGKKLDQVLKALGKE